MEPNESCPTENKNAMAGFVWQAAAEGGENDMRFLYCAAAISKFLNNEWVSV